MKLTKNQRRISNNDTFQKVYPLEEAVQLLKDTAYTKFDSSVDIAVNLALGAKKVDQGLRGSVVLPYGNGKKLSILALCTPDKEQEAKDAGATYVGLEEYLNKIEKGWLDIDAIVTMPSVMPKLGRLGKKLGPRGLMPNPKLGNVTLELGKEIQAIKNGKINFRLDKYDIVHASIGRVSFSVEKIAENVREFMEALVRLKLSTGKPVCIKKVAISTTMGKGIKVRISKSDKQLSS